MAVESDFAVLVLGPDDRVISRGDDNLAPRDNVVLELGLFIGAVGRRRVFLVMPAGLDVKIPTDLLGVTPVWYEPDGDPADLPARLRSACSDIRAALEKLGPR